VHVAAVDRPRELDVDEDALLPLVVVVDLLADRKRDLELARAGEREGR